MSLSPRVKPINSYLVGLEVEHFHMRTAMVAGHRPLEHLWCTAPPSPDDHHGDLHAPPAAPRSQFDNTGVRVLTDAHMRFSSHG